MLRNWEKELEGRVAFIRKTVEDAGALGIVYGNSGGKDSALVGILCKRACENTLGVLMPCESARNFSIDMDDGLKVAEQFGIESVTADLSSVKAEILCALTGVQEISAEAQVNLAPRLRMTALYAVAQSRGCLVAGTGNRSEAYVGYFTKWGDGAHDFNPISDLTVTEIFEFLRFLGAPGFLIEKAPSAGLYDGQTDETEMGFTYRELDRYLLCGEASPETLKKIEAMHRKSRHKREPVVSYRGTAG